MTERTEDAQSAALRAFLLLCALGDDWRGRLVLVRGLDAEGRAVSIAASVAGAACLAVDSRAEVCRATLRAGACDFVVNSVDEALRILKNEVRKRKPVSVAVAIGEAAALEELLERGVVPDLFVAGSDEFGVPFAELGARLVSEVEAATLVDGYAAARGWVMREFQVTTAEELRVFDQRLAAAIAEADPRRRWAAVAPGFFYRERPYRRVAYLTELEASKLL